MKLLKTENQRTMVSLITSIVAMGLNIVISFFLSPYIVKNFGEEANGFTQLANNFVNYASLLTVALNSMAARFITISYCNGDYDKCNKYYSSVLIGNFFIFAILVIPAIVFLFYLDSLINIETANVFHVKLLFSFVFVNFFFSLASSVFGISFYVKNAQYIQNTITAMRYFLNICGLLLLFSVFVPAIYFVSLMGCILSLLTVPCYLFIKRKIMPEIKFSIKSFDLKAIGKMLSSGIWNTLNQCGNLLMTGFDLLLSNLLIGATPMGILSVAKTVPNCIVQLGATVNTSFSPNLTIAYAGGKKDNILSSLRYSMKCSGLLMSIPLMVLCVFGMPFYALWVPSMDANQLAILSVLTCAAFIPFSGTQTLYNVYTTTNKLKVNSISVLVGGLINILVVYILLKYTNWGLFAVAGVSTAISIIRNTVITVPYTAKLLGLKWYTFYKDVLISLIGCLFAGLVCFGFSKIILTTSWGGLVVAVLLSCIVSALLLVLILLKKDERRRLLNKFRRKKQNG